MIRQEILTMGVDVIDCRAAVDAIVDLANQRKGGYVCVANVHMCMEVFDSDTFRAVLDGADLVVADGKPLSLAQKLLGHGQARQVRGQDLMNSICALSGELRLKIGLYGGASEEVLLAVERNLNEYYPGVQICYTFVPPFHPLNDEEEAAVVGQIEKAGVDILFVGIGCPKQEIWMAAHAEKLDCVMIGVGAAFDFVAGNKQHAPRWMQQIGLEWLFRLCSEPSRLWKRYLKQNPRFVWHFLQQWLLGRNYFQKIEGVDCGK